MDRMTIVGLALVLFICVAAMVELCLVIERRNKAEARRERFGLRPHERPWP